MKIGLMQYNPKWEDKEENKRRIEKILSETAGNVSLLVFPEMTLTGFTMNPSVFSEEIQGESFLFFSKLASGYNMHICAGIIEKDKNIFCNTLIHINSEGNLVSRYRKIHPFSHSGENLSYHRGDKPVTSIVNGLSTGFSICYDLRFPELFRYYGKEKVELIINIANWPSARIEHWKTLLKARAIENQCYTAGVNRVGDDPDLHYPGCSAIFDPMGNEVGSLEDEEGVIEAEIKKEMVEETRRNLPFLEDIYLI